MNKFLLWALLIIGVICVVLALITGIPAFLIGAIVFVFAAWRVGDEDLKAGFFGKSGSDDYKSFMDEALKTDEVKSVEPEITAEQLRRRSKSAMETRPHSYDDIKMKAMHSALAGWHAVVIWGSISDNDLQRLESGGFRIRPLQGRGYIVEWELLTPSI